MCTSKGIWELQIDHKQTLVDQPKKYPELKQLADIPITDLVYFTNVREDGIYTYKTLGGYLCMRRDEQYIRYINS